MRNWQEVKLSNMCYFSSDKIEVSNLSLDNYISTENMLPNRVGICRAVNLPNTSLTVAFNFGDILLSNIRPYFKKIWLANFNGGCSNDVLVLKAKENIDAKFLYYILSDNKFFAYDTANAKGTKMPRGDKAAIMNYEFSLPPLDVQKKIARVLGVLDDKIELNNRINNNLEQQAQALFKSWFIDFEPFGGTMPDDWKEINLSDIATFVGGYSYKGSELQTSSTAMATIKNFDRSGGFKLDGFKEIIPSSKVKSTQYVELFDTLVAHTDLTQNAEVIGNAEILYSKNSYQNIIISMDVVKVMPQKGISKFLLATLLKDNRFKQHCLGYINGTTVLHLSKKALPEYTFAFPNSVDTVNELTQTLEYLYKKLALNIEENTRLAQLRDTLLPKLMSGEIDVSNVNISELSSNDKLSFSEKEIKNDIKQFT